MTTLHNAHACMAWRIDPNAKLVDNLGTALKQKLLLLLLIEYHRSRYRVQQNINNNNKNRGSEISTKLFRAHVAVAAHTAISRRIWAPPSGVRQAVMLLARGGPRDQQMVPRCGVTWSAEMTVTSQTNRPTDIRIDHSTVSRYHTLKLSVDYDVIQQEGRQSACNTTRILHSSCSIIFHTNDSLSHTAYCITRV